jgi:hypothetical protein
MEAFAHLPSQVEFGGAADELEFAAKGIGQKYFALGGEIQALDIPCVRHVLG